MQNSSLPATAPYSARQAMGVLLLMVVATLSLDLARFPLNVLTDPVRHSFGITDVQFSLLLGAFVSIPVLVMSLVGGWLSDRISRRALLGAGMLMWTAGAFACALAATFDQMAVGRVLVALGAGIKLPVAMTWINDAFAPDKRGRVIGAFFIVLGLGPAQAAALTGTVQHLADTGAFAGWPLLGTLDPWRATLLLLAVPSLLLLPLVFRLRDVRAVDTHRAAPGATDEASHAQSPVRWGLIAALIGSMSLMVMVDHANVAWMPTVFKRTFGYSAQQAGFMFGIVATIAGLAGPVLGGWIGDHVFRRYGATGRLWLCAAAAAICAPILFAYFGHEPALLVFALAVNGVLTVAVLVLGYVTIQSMLPPQRRGFGTGLTNAAVTLLASSSPTLVAVMSDRILSGPDALAQATAIVGASLAIAAAVALALTARASRAQPAP